MTTHDILVAAIKGFIATSQTHDSIDVLDALEAWEDAGMPDVPQALRDKGGLRPAVETMLG